ncbi:MAG TPA: DUF4193 family protein [Acidimicrobiales bacterium]|nr:DUF4193 family protein [Acidimicrobiales bacterium]
MGLVSGRRRRSAPPRFTLLRTHWMPKDDLDDDLLEESDELPEDLDEEDLEDIEDEEEDGLDDDDDVLAEDDEDLEGADEGSEVVVKAREEDEDDEDEEDEDTDDVEASLDVILKERLVVVDEDEVEDEEELADGDDRGDSPLRVLPKQPGEFVCQSCFLVKHPSQLADGNRMLCRDCV